MILILAALAASGASLLTFYSGFGLVTLLTPVFLLFFPAPTAVAAVALVHFVNNGVKAGLVGRHAQWDVVLRFGIPAMIAAAAGAALLGVLAFDETGFHWSIAGLQGTVRPVQALLGGMMIAFAFLELRPPRGLSGAGLVFGGLLSGFFGGLTGHQGALRSAFLVRAGLDPRAFVGTGVAIALGVDLVRIFIYGTAFDLATIGQEWPLLLSTTLGAITGSVLGARGLQKVTVARVQHLVAVMLLVTGLVVGLGLGGG
jgi:uncharacterized membrane protein YfcA